MIFQKPTLKLRFFAVLTLLFLGIGQTLQAQTYFTGRITFTYNDPARSTTGFGSGGGAGRQIQCELYYPALTAGTNTTVAAGRFPIIVFAHGFQMTWDSYEILYDSLVRNGYIVVAPRTEGGLSPAHAEFGKDLAVVLDRSLQFDTIATSLFFGKVIQKGAIMGHSMGGGCTFLADQYNSRATCYFAMAPANTNPRSSLAAKTISKPYCILGGTKDCVAPIAANQQLMYDSLLVSTCKQLIKITDARHCSFSDGNSTQCNFGEGFSGCANVSNGYTTAMQNVTICNIAVPYFNYFLKGICSEWAVYQNYITTTARLVTSQSCTMNVPSNATVSGASSFCAGGSSTLTASPSGFNYSWSNGGNAITNSVSTAGNFTVSVSNPYCSINSNPFSITVNNAPATPAAILGIDTICANSSGQLYSVSTVPTATAYQWTVPSGWSITNQTTVSPIFTTNGQGGSITVEAINSCGTSSAKTKTITIAPSITNNTSLSTCGSFVFGGQNLTQSGIYRDTVVSQAGCDSIIILNLTINQASASARFDSICAGNSFQFGTQNITQGGQYTRTIPNSASCDSVITLNLFVLPTPSVSITQSGPNLSATTGFASYEWKLNGNTVTTTIVSNYVATANGSYTVEATDVNGCASSVSSAVQVIGLSIASLDGGNIGLSISPNPVSEILTISATGKVTEVNLYDMQGKMVKTIWATSKIDMQTLHAGVYLVEVKTTTGIGKTMVVKD